MISAMIPTRWYIAMQPLNGKRLQSLATVFSASLNALAPLGLYTEMSPAIFQGNGVLAAPPWAEYDDEAAVSQGRSRKLEFGSRPRQRQGR